MASPVAAVEVADGSAWCGTDRARLAVSLAVHRDHERRLARQRPAVAAQRSAPQASRSGDIAVLVDDGTLVLQPNAFDLAGSGVQFTPLQKKKARGFTVSAASVAVNPDIGEPVGLSDDASFEVRFPKGFSFPFFGGLYNRMHVHSDGNLTFGAPDAASTPRSLGRFLNGPPRVAVLFADLNPETAGAGAGIYLSMSKTRVMVTWLEVPEFGAENRNTFQVTLFKDGRLTLAFGEVEGQTAIVGVAPGGGQLQLLDYSADLPIGVLSRALAERFSLDRELDDLGIARAFFSQFADDYDHLIVWLDFNFRLGGAFAYEFTLKNEIRGIGDGVYDFSGAAGSRGRLRSFVQMGALSRYPSDPDETFLGTNSTMDVLGQETGHRWGAFVRFRDADGQPSTALLGRSLAHWSFVHHTYASDLEGNAIRQEGDHFTTVASTERFSPLDQYLMGLIPPAEVEPFFYVADTNLAPESAPAADVQFAGRRVDVGIEDVIAAEGGRVPESSRAPHGFTMAFVLVVAAGQEPSAAGLAKLEGFRARWGPYFQAATDFHGEADTTLRDR